MIAPLDALFLAAETRPHQIAFIADDPHQAAFVADDRIWSFRRFAGEVERAARALSARGVEPGDRVALHMANVPEMAIACFACFRLGAIAAPLNNRFNTMDLQSLLERLRPALYVGQDHLYPLAAPVAPRILPMEARFVFGSATANGGARSWADLFDHGDVALGAHRPAEAAPALLLTTSGTTGQPKFVAHSPATMAAIAEGFVHFGLVPGDTIVNSCPMAHASGLFPFIASIHHEATTVLLERFDPEAVLDAIETHQGSWMVGLPPMFATMLERQRARPREMSSLRFCVSSGDVCPASLQQEFPFAFGRPLHSIWSMTEAAAILAFGERPGPVTRIPAGAEIRIVDGNGAAVPRGVPGELLVRGPNVALGYWAGPERIEPCAADGWLVTGDIMRQGDGDELWFVRKNDLIVRGGSKTSPKEVHGC